MNAYFLRPGDNKNSIERIEKLFLSLRTLYISVAYFNSVRLSELIKIRAEKKQRTYLLINTSDILRPKDNVGTEIVISQALMSLLNHNNDYLWIKSLGLKMKGKYQNMHHKFIFNDLTLIFGSVNFTDAGFARNYESFIETKDTGLIQSFKAEFNDMWKIASDIATGADGKIRTLMCPVCEKHEGVDFESYGLECSWCGHKFKLS